MGNLTAFRTAAVPARGDAKPAAGLMLSKPLRLGRAAATADRSHAGRSRGAEWRSSIYCALKSSNPDGSYPQIMANASAVRLLFSAFFGLQLAVPTPAFSTENILFIGNSFTYGFGCPAVENNGGVPKLVEVIAAAKGRKAAVAMRAGAKEDWGCHLSEPKTERALHARPWNWVVLQDASTKPTRLGNLNRFLENGKALYHRIRDHSPGTMIVLYETWARGGGYSYYSVDAAHTTFVSPAEMTTELRRGYATLKEVLGDLEPGEQVRLARVGTAFALCQKQYPKINLFYADRMHASDQGNYLAALVIYATIFRDSPLGAPRKFAGFTIAPHVAAKLQQIAAETPN